MSAPLVLPQSVRDALADAETLRLGALDHFAAAVASGEMYRLRLREYMCSGAADVARLAWPDGRPLLPEVPDAVFYEMARNDAHAAFSAVSTLRGCTLHEPCLLDEGTFCRQCGMRLPSHAAMLKFWSGLHGFDEASYRAAFRAVPGLR